MLPTVAALLHAYDEPCAPKTSADYGESNITSAVSSSSIGEATLPVTNPKQIAKVKLLDVHVTQPWVLSADVAGVVSVWDYSSRRQLDRFSPSAWKDAQYNAAIALEEIDEIESSSIVVSAASAAASKRKLRRPTGLFGGSVSAVSSKSYRVGSILSVSFADESTLSWSVGTFASVGPFSRPMHQWLAIVCEYRVFLYDYNSHRVYDFSAEEYTKKSMAITAIARMDSTRVVAACSDGGLRVWGLLGDTGGSFVMSPDCDTFDESRSRPLSHVFVCAIGDTVVHPHTHGAAVSSVCAAAVGVDGDVTVWGIIPGGGFNLKSGPILRVSLDCEVKSVTFHRHSKHLSILAASGKAAFIVSLAGDSPTTLVSKVCGSGGSKLSYGSAMVGNARLSPFSLLAIRQGHFLDVMSPDWSPMDAPTRPDSIDPAMQPILELAQLSSFIPPTLIPEELKGYVVTQHPFRPDIYCIGTNVGLLVLSIAAGYTQPPIVPVLSTTAGDPTLAAMLCGDGSVATVLAASTAHSDISIIDPVMDSTLARIMPPVTGGKPSPKPSCTGGSLTLSKSGKYIALVWPHLKVYAVYTVPSPEVSQSLIDSGMGVDIVWCGATMPVSDVVPGECYCILEPAIVYKAPPKVKGGPDQTPPPPQPSSLSFRAVVPNSSGGLEAVKVKIGLTGGRPPAYLFSGPLLGVSFASDAVTTAWTAALGPFERCEANVSTMMQFYDWAPKPYTGPPPTSAAGRAVADGSLKPVGPTLPAPATVLWDATHSRAALSYAQRVDIFAVVSGVDASSKRPSKLRSTPTLQLLSSVTISFASSGVWYRNSLFVCNRSGVFAIFPRLLPSESQPQLSGALGLSSSVVIQLASVHPQPATFGVEPYVTNLPCTVVLGVRGGSVMLATPTHRISGNGAPPVKVLCVPLSSPSIKSLLCIMAGAPASAAVHWAAALPPECQSPFAVSVAALGAPEVSLALPHLPPSLGVSIALQFRHKPYLRWLLSTADMTCLEEMVPKLSVLSKRHTTCPQYSTLLQSIADVLLPKDGATTADSRADAALLEKCMNSTVTDLPFDPSSVALSEAMGATSTLLL